MPREKAALPYAAAPASPPGTPATGGWHWTEWCCEATGTAILLFGGLSGLFLDFAPGSPVAPALPGQSSRLLLTGLILGVTGLIVTASPLGRRSGAHLNPSVTLAFWCRGHVHVHDLAGYVAAQVIGAMAGTQLARWCWGTRATALDLGVTRPGHGIGAPGATAIEALLTFVLLMAILAAVSSPRAARWTPAVAWGTVALLVWQAGALTGASLNPARSLAPALLAPDTGGLWIYITGPVAGALLAAAVITALPGTETRTAKLLHDPRYPSTLAATLPVAPPPARKRRPVWPDQVTRRRPPAPQAGTAREQPASSRIPDSSKCRDRRPIMVTHRFARAAESGDPAKIAALLTEDVTFHTPVLTQELHGKDHTLRFLGEATRIIANLTYTDEVTDGERVFLFWKGTVDDREISGVTVLEGETRGLISDITVLLRSWGVVANFRDTMLRALADAVPLAAWQLDDGKTPPPDPDAGVGQRPGGPLPLAPDVAFHSPMLTKTAYGEQNVEDIHKLIGGIQGPRTYLARITTEQTITEYWDCVIQGHAQQGIDVFELDAHGRVVNQTVWLRPWPVVSVLRDAAIAGQLPSLPADYWLLPAAPSQLS